MNRLRTCWLPVLLVGVLRGQIPDPPPPPPTPKEPFWPEHRQHGPKPSRIIQKREPLAMGAKLWIKNRNGQISVEAWDMPEVALEALIWDSSRRPIAINIQRKGADLEIETFVEEPRWNFGFGFVVTPRCEMKVRVPRKVLGYFKTMNGTIRLKGVEGYAQCETANGDIRLGEGAGEFFVVTRNGAIEAKRMKARLRGHTTNGGLFLDEVEGGIDLETTDGNITATDLDGWGEGISLSTLIGNIDVKLGRAGGEVVAESLRGSVDFKVTNAHVVSQSRRTLRLKVPGKPQKVTLKTRRGDIRITQ